MALPKLSAPTLTFTLPLSKLKISYRRFLVKEEKVLLIAAESGLQSDLIQAFRQVINNCIITEVDVDKVPMFDLEIMFLLLRINSVSNLTEFRIPDPFDGELYTVEVDIQQIVDKIISELVIPEKQFQLTDEIGVIMKDVTLESFDNGQMPSSGDISSDEAFRLLGQMIEKVFDKDAVYPTKDFTDREVLDFVESFNQEALQKVQNYVAALPKLSYTVEYKKKDGTPGELKLEGLSDFFQYA
jgi:hypothetical protein